MFVKVEVLKAFGFGGKKLNIGDALPIRRSQAKVLQALGKVKILQDTETKTASFVPVKKSEVVEIPDGDEVEVVGATTDAETPAETPVDAVEEVQTETKEDEAEVVTETPSTDVVADEKPAKKRKGKYQTKVMTAE